MFESPRIRIGLLPLKDQSCNFLCCLARWYVGLNLAGEERGWVGRDGGEGGRSRPRLVGALGPGTGRSGNGVSSEFFV